MGFGGEPTPQVRAGHSAWEVERDARREDASCSAERFRRAWHSGDPMANAAGRDRLARRRAGCNRRRRGESQLPHRRALDAFLSRDHGVHHPDLPELGSRPTAIPRTRIGPLRMADWELRSSSTTARSRISWPGSPSSSTPARCCSGSWPPANTPGTSATARARARRPTGCSTPRTRTGSGGMTPIRGAGPGLQRPDRLGAARVREAHRRLPIRGCRAALPGLDPHAGTRAGLVRPQLPHRRHGPLAAHHRLHRAWPARVRAARSPSDRLLEASRRTASRLAGCVRQDGRMAGPLRPQLRASRALGLPDRHGPDRRSSGAGRTRSNPTPPSSTPRTWSTGSSCGSRISVRAIRDCAAAIRGSFPANGAYGEWRVLNWATKFFVDALLVSHATPRCLHFRG